MCQCHLSFKWFHPTVSGSDDAAKKPAAAHKHDLGVFTTLPSAHFCFGMQIGDEGIQRTCQSRHNEQDTHAEATELTEIRYGH